MDSSLQILGSILVAAAVPLVLYLYLNIREARREALYQRLRTNVARTLACQIGEGRTLAVFEIRSVIDAKMRDWPVRPRLLTVAEVVEDLVAETMTTPMLDGQRKEQIVDNLRQIHNQWSSALDRPAAVMVRNSGETFATLFGWIATGVTLALFLGAATLDWPFGERFRQDQYVLDALLGLVASVVSLAVAAASRLLGDALSRGDSPSDPADATHRLASIKVSDGLTAAAERLRQRILQDRRVGPQATPEAAATKVIDLPVEQSQPQPMGT